MYFTQNLRALRENESESQQNIGDILGVTKQTIGRYENGECEPDLKALIILADHFEVSVDDLLRKDLRPPTTMSGKNLRYLRLKNHLTQDGLANLLKVKRATIGNYETETREIPISKLMVIADFFGITLDQLVKQDLSEVEHGNRSKDVKYQGMA